MPSFLPSTDTAYLLTFYKIVFSFGSTPCPIIMEWPLFCGLADFLFLMKAKQNPVEDLLHLPAHTLDSRSGKFQGKSRERRGENV